jgi:hypothetical protein
VLHGCKTAFLLPYSGWRAVRLGAEDDPGTPYCRATREQGRLSRVARPREESRIHNLHRHVRGAAGTGRAREPQRVSETALLDGTHVLDARRKIRPTRKLFAPRFWRTRSHPATSLLNRKVVKDLLARPLGTTSSIPERAGLERARSISACGEGLRRRAGPVVNTFVSRDPQATESEDIASKFLLPLISWFSGRPGSVGPRS